MLDLLFLCLLTGWAALVGRQALAALGLRAADPTETLALAVPLGLGAFGLGALALGEFGLLNRGGFLVLLGIGLVSCGTSLWREDLPALKSKVKNISPLIQLLSNTLINMRVSHSLFPEISKRTTEADRGRRLGFAFDLALVVTLAATLLVALTPVTDGDALCYHLQVPKVFLAQGAVDFDPDLHETVYPLLVEMIYASALAFRGPVACRLVQWIFGVCLAAAVTLAARPWLGPRARWAGTLALLVPAVSNGMSAPLNDVALAAYGMAALASWMKWLQGPSHATAILSGVLAGMAMGVKYPALVWTGVLGLGMGITWLTQRVMAARTCRGSASADRSRQNQGNHGFAHILAFSGFAILIGGCWYARAYSHTGNPVHPFFRHTFGGAGLDEVLDPIKRPMEPTVWNLATALGPMTLEPDRFDSFSHQFGPAFLLFLPALLISRPPARLAGLVAMGYSFLILCLTQRQSMRFVLIAVGPMAIGVAWLADRWGRDRSKAAQALGAMLLCVLLFESGLAVARVRHGFRAAVGLESEEAYLTRREPTYRVGRWIAAHLPEGARIIGQDHRGFYLPRPYTMELAHRRRTGLGSRGEQPWEILSTLHARGYTHLLMAVPIPEDAVEFDPTLGRRLEPWLASQAPIYQEEIQDPDGVTRRYALYDLAGSLNLTQAGVGQGSQR